MNTEQVVKRIKQARIDQGLSYQSLADITGMSKSTLQRYETGHIKNLSVGNLEILANALKVSPAYLMGWEENIIIKGGYNYGYKVIYKLLNGVYTAFYEDTGEEVEFSKPRSCPRCSKFPTKEGHDPCLGTLPGVKFACCGHGITEEAYITFENGITVRNFIIDHLE